MTRWKIKLNDMSGDTLTEMLDAEGFALDGDMLSGLEFEALQTDQEVSKHARELMLQIREISRLTDEVDNDFNVSLVYEFDTQGNQIAEHTAVFQTDGHIALSLSGFTAAIGHADQLTPEEKVKRARIAKVQHAQALMRATRKTDLVLTVLKLLDGGVTGTDLGKVREFIQDDIGGALYPRFCTKAEFIRFKHSINHPKALGEDARHAVSREEPPSDPMTKIEARDFMDRVSSAWIQELACGARD